MGKWKTANYGNGSTKVKKRSHQSVNQSTPEILTNSHLAMKPRQDYAHCVTLNHCKCLLESVSVPTSQLMLLRDSHPLATRHTAIWWRHICGSTETKLQPTMWPLCSWYSRELLDSGTGSKLWIFTSYRTVWYPFCLAGQVLPVLIFVNGMWCTYPKNETCTTVTPSQHLPKWFFLLRDATRSIYYL